MKTSVDRAISEALDRLDNEDFQLPIPADFNEAAYLADNPDVAAAIKEGAVTSGYSHYVRHGRHEGRPRPTLAAEA